MDGVLIDARMWHFEALNRALKLFGMDISMHEHLSKFDGLPTKVKLELLSSEAGLPRGLHQFINELKQTYTVEMGYLHCRPNFYHQYALAKLSADGYKMAVCSNSIKKTIDLLLSRAEIKDFFNLYLSSEDVTLPKPSPEIYVLAMSRLKVMPSECLILEDNENGIRAALDSGAHVMKINDVNNVNYENILRYISTLR